jgi:hypothetical protein
MSGAVRLLSGLLLISACATPAPDSRFDGHYAGASTRTRGGVACGPESEAVAVSIRGGTFGYLVPTRNYYTNVNYLVPITVQVASTGEVRGASLYYADDPRSRQGWRTAWMTVVGTVSDDHLEADVNSLNCGWHLSLGKELTRSGPVSSSGPYGKSG